MNRRIFFQATGATAVALSLPLTLQAAEGEQQVLIQNEIGNNHGHALSLNIAQVVELFGLTSGGVDQVMSIQGQSGHPHEILLNQEMLVALLADRQLEVESTLVAGHSHSVLISLEIA